MTSVLPGSMIGIIGGGQLGRMLSLEARRMGYNVCILDPTPHCPASQVADLHLRAPFDDPHALQQLADVAHVVTYETEHIPIATLRYCATATVLRPSASLLETVQDRLTQKQFLSAHGVPQARYAAVDDERSLRTALQQIGFPAILKSRHSGYDGKGQARINDERDLLPAWATIGKVPAVVEGYVPFRAEVSVILARNVSGDVRYYPVAENVHRHHILHTTRVPARIPNAIHRRAEALARTLAEALDYHGVMTVEMFLLPDGALLVNEIAPRVHNSGHYTFGACVTSQFEQHLRGVCGLPLGETTLLRPAVMVNLMGELWEGGVPPWHVVFRHPNAQLHLYGKDEARPGRKMGHVLILGDDTDRLLREVDVVLAELCSSEQRPQTNDRPALHRARQSALPDGAVFRPRDSRGPLGI